MGDKVYSPPAYKVEGKPNFRPALLHIMRNWPWVALSFLVMLAAFAVYLHYQVPVFRVHASLLIKGKVSGDHPVLSSIPGAKQTGMVAHRNLEDEMEILTSYTLMDRVVKKLGLDVRYYSSTEGLQREMYAMSPIQVVVEKASTDLYTNELKFKFLNKNTVLLNDRKYPVNQSINTQYGRLRVIPRKPLSGATLPVVVTVAPRPRTVRTYLAKLEIEPVSKQSGVLDINLVEAVPDKGEAILNQLIEEYIREDVLQKNKEARNVLGLIEDRLASIADELTTHTNETETAANTKSGNQAYGFLNTSEKNETLLTEVDRKLGGLKTIEQYIENNVGKAYLEQAALTLSDPALINLVKQALALEIKREQKGGTLSGDSAFNRQLKQVKYNIYRSVKAIQNRLTQSRRQLLATNRRIDRVIQTIPDRGNALLSILRQPAIRNNLYAYLLQKREDAVMSAIYPASDSRVVDAPRADEIPLEPVNATIFVLFGVTGLLLPIVFIGVKNAFNNRITRRTDVEALSPIPILGEIALSQQISADNLVFKPRIQSVMGEQVRALRTNLQYAGNDPQHNQVILFTSCISGEGKSLISLNLGASLALVGRKTIILEMDMRKPRLHKSLYLENRVGISNYLIEEATVDEIIQPIMGYNDYFIATAGPLPLNPAELLSSSRLSQLLYELKERFDHIVIDSPPVGLVTDSQLIAPFADITLFIVRHNYTPKQCIKVINNLHKGNRFPNLNIVLNAVGEGEIRYSSYYDGDYTLNPV